MAPNEPYLKDYICSNCHFSILEIHPEETLANQHWYKCITCGFSKQIIKDIKYKASFDYGKPRKD